MEFVQAIMGSLLSHTYLASIVAGLLGEEAVLFLTILQSVNGVNLWILLLLAPIGLWLIDIGYYSIGQIGILSRAGSEIKKIEEHGGILPKIIRFSNKRPLFAMIITKFIYGTRAGLIVYLSTQKIKFEKFLLYNLVAIEVWAFLMVPIAWSIGQWWGKSGVNILENFLLIVALALGFIIALDTLIRFVYLRFRKIEKINSK